MDVELRKDGKGSVLLFCLIGAAAVLLLCLVCAGVAYYVNLPHVAEEVTVEAGGDLPEVEDFLDKSYAGAEFLTDVENTVRMGEIGDYDIALKVSFWEYHSVLHVVDTTPPEVQTRDVRILDYETVKAMDFIESVEDVTETEVAYEEEPRLTEAGTWPVCLLVTDAAGNTTRAEANLEVIADQEAPVIEGVEDLTVEVGGTVSYKENVTVTDDYDEEVELKVDNSGVDLENAGNYEVVYSAEDRSGNRAEARAVLHVVAPMPKGVSEEAVYAAADRILAQITTAGMSQYDVAKAIYNWAHSNIGYVNGTNEDNWIQAAYDGLISRRGDCYVYAMSAKCLLTRAGIVNMIIHKIPTATSSHYWNLIDIGEGWHHFDTTRRHDGSTFFYLTDAELMAYSDTHNGTHNYDRSQYPVIP